MIVFNLEFYFVLVLVIKKITSPKNTFNRCSRQIQPRTAFRSILLYKVFEIKLESVKGNIQYVKTSFVDSGGMSLTVAI